MLQAGSEAFTADGNCTGGALDYCQLSTAAVPTTWQIKLMKAGYGEKGKKGTSNRERCLCINYQSSSSIMSQSKSV